MAAPDANAARSGRARAGEPSMSTATPQDPTPQDPASAEATLAARWATRRRILFKLALIAGLVVLINFAVGWITPMFDAELRPHRIERLEIVMLVSAAAYVLLMALPFMPGIEVGLAMMLTLGPRAAVVVYLCTVLALTLSFAVGRLVPGKVLAAFFGWLHFDRARDLLREMEPLTPRERVAFLAANAPRRIVPFALRHRYLLIAFALNLPGNALIGGGGGIAMVAGMSRLFRWPQYVLLIAAATAPVPVLILLGAWKG
jgi:hypothetical protein